jgi:hypothetical protein
MVYTPPDLPSTQSGTRVCLHLSTLAYWQGNRLKLPLINERERESKPASRFLTPAPAGESFARPAFDSGWWLLFCYVFSFLFCWLTLLFLCHSFLFLLADLMMFASCLGRDNIEDSQTLWSMYSMYHFMGVGDPLTASVFGLRFGFGSLHLYSLSDLH